MIHFGIIGAGNIAHRFAASLSNLDNAKLYAISGRNIDKLNKFMEKFPCSKKYLSYDELLEDSDVDAVYISLPNFLHKEYSLKALKAHKAVLCEKPAMVNEEEMEEVKTCAIDNNILFMEAMKSRFTPAYIEITNIINSGIIGDIKSIDTKISFNVMNDQNRPSHFSDPKTGGVLRDSGIYCASYYESFLKDKIIVDDVKVKYYLDSDINDVVLIHSGNITGKIEVAFDGPKEYCASIKGNKGEIIIFNPHRPDAYDLVVDGVLTHHDCPYIVDDFYGQIKHFCSLIENKRTESDIMPLSASLKMARLIDDIYKKMK